MGETISTRWKQWAEKEPGWAYTALGLMMAAFAGLGVHLGVLEGFWRTFGLVVMIICAGGVELILGLRKQWWWFTFWTYVILGVCGWEIASYFFGG